MLKLTNDDDDDDDKDDDNDNNNDDDSTGDTIKFLKKSPRFSFLNSLSRNIRREEGNFLVKISWEICISNFLYKRYRFFIYKWCDHATYDPN